MRARGFVAFSALAFLLACRDPTQITLEVLTDVPCSASPHADIAVGTLDSIDQRVPSASTNTCVDGHMGTLVVVPSGANDEEIAFKVVAGFGVSASECMAKPEGEIASPPNERFGSCRTPGCAFRSRSTRPAAEYGPAHEAGTIGELA